MTKLSEFFRVWNEREILLSKLLGKASNNSKTKFKAIMELDAQIIARSGEVLKSSQSIQPDNAQAHWQVLVDIVNEMQGDHYHMENKINLLEFFLMALPDIANRVATIHSLIRMAVEHIVPTADQCQSGAPPDARGRIGILNKYKNFCAERSKNKDDAYDLLSNRLGRYINVLSTGDMKLMIPAAMSALASTSSSVAR